MKAKKPIWTEAEKEILKSYDKKKVPELMKKLPGRTAQSISLKAQRLGFAVKRHGFTEERKLKVIELHGKGYSDLEIGDAIGLSNDRVLEYREKLGLQSNFESFKPYVARKCESEGLSVVHSPTHLWILRFVKLFPMTIFDLLKYLGMSRGSKGCLQRRCCELVRQGLLHKEKMYYIYPDYNYEDVSDTLGTFDIKSLPVKRS